MLTLHRWVPLSKNQNLPLPCSPFPKDTLTPHLPLRPRFHASTLGASLLIKRLYDVSA